VVFEAISRPQASALSHVLRRRYVCLFRMRFLVLFWKIFTAACCQVVQHECQQECQCALSSRVQKQKNGTRLRSRFSATGTFQVFGTRFSILESTWTQMSLAVSILILRTPCDSRPKRILPKAGLGDVSPKWHSVLSTETRLSCRGTVTSLNSSVSWNYSSSE
jgi:hypothetical protein